MSQGTYNYNEAFRPETSNLNIYGSPKRVQYTQLTNVSTAQTEDNHSTISEIRALREEMIRRDENNRKINEERNEHFNRIITKLTEEVITLKNEVRQMKLNTTTCQTNEESISKQLPFSCAGKLQNFDEELKTNGEVAAQFKRMILRLGGHDLPSFVRTAIKRIITDDLAMQLSWRGTKEKRSIQTYFFVSILKDMVHQKFPNADDAKLNNILQKHLVHAKDRIEKRKAKQSKN